MKKNPLVSILMPCFNSSARIGASIESVLNQTFENFELIIIDDCSTDSTQEILKNFSELDSRIKIFRNRKNLGAARTRNVGLTNANGKYICFLDSDDLWLQTKLAEQISFMEAKKINFSFTGYYIQYESNPTQRNEVIIPPSLSYYDLLKNNRIGCLTAMYDSHFFGKVPMPEFQIGEDFGLWLSLLKKTNRAWGLQKPLAIYTARKDSLSASKIKNAKNRWDVYRKQEKLSFLRSCYFFILYGLTGLKKLNKFSFK